MHAELGQVVLRLHQHVEQVRHRRALVAADVGDAGLQQRLGDREDALAVEDLAGAEAQHAATSLLNETSTPLAPAAAAATVAPI